MLVALTGGVASGKSLALALFQKRGYPTFSADTIYHDLIEQGKPLYNSLINAFGLGILTAEKIDLKKLSKIVFDDENQRAKLSSLTHDAIFSEIVKLTKDLPVAIVEVPLLFESGMQNQFDKIILITASESVRLARMKEYRGIDLQQAKKRIDSLLSDTDKIKKADIVIYNDGDIQEFIKKVQEVQI